MRTGVVLFIDDPYPQEARMLVCSFRLAAPRDESAILSLMAAYYAYDGLAFERNRARNAVQALISDEQLGELWLIVHAGTPVGYYALTFGFSLECGGRDAFMDELFLLEAHRGQGIGAQTVRHAIARCRTREIRALRLEATHRNVRAAGLYRRLGFEDHDRYLMTLSL